MTLDSSAAWRFIDRITASQVTAALLSTSGPGVLMVDESLLERLSQPLVNISGKRLIAVHKAPGSPLADQMHASAKGEAASAERLGYPHGFSFLLAWTDLAESPALLLQSCRDLGAHLFVMCNHDELDSQLTTLSAWDLEVVSAFSESTSENRSSQSIFFTRGITPEVLQRCLTVIYSPYELAASGVRWQAYSPDAMEPRDTEPIGPQKDGPGDSSSV